MHAACRLGVIAVSSFIRQRPELYRSQSAVLLETQQGDLLLDAGKADVGYQLDHYRLQVSALAISTVIMC